jgi:hypothetical protein
LLVGQQVLKLYHLVGGHGWNPKVPGRGCLTIGLEEALEQLQAEGSVSQVIAVTKQQTAGTLRFSSG